MKILIFHWSCLVQYNRIVLLSFLEIHYIIRIMWCEAMKGGTIMENIQYCLIHNFLVGENDNINFKPNEPTSSYLNKIKQAYDNFGFCVGKNYAPNEILDAYDSFYSMIDARIPCLFNVAHDYKIKLHVAFNRKENFEKTYQEKSFCLLQSYMFKL